MRVVPPSLAVVVLGAVLCPVQGHSKDNVPPWKVILTGRLVVKTRPVPGTPASEFWAEGEMAAPVQDIQSTLVEHEHFPRFMPMVKETRTVGKPLDDGSLHVYTRVEPPMVAHRDYIVRVHLIESVREDGTGNFRNQWAAASHVLPEQPDVVRLKINDGSWYVTPIGDGQKSWVVYRSRTEPGGWVPSFLLDMANKTGVLNSFNAVEKEAQRRALQRKAQTGR